MLTPTRLDQPCDRMSLYESFMVNCPGLGLYYLFGPKILPLCFVGLMFYCVEVSFEAEVLLILGLGDVWVQLL
jgi:hypothetical protein